MTMKAPAALLPAPFTVSMMKSPGQTRNARSRSRCIVGLRPATKASALPDLGTDPIDHLLALDPGGRGDGRWDRCRGLARSEEHTSELQSLAYLVCRLLLEKKKKHYTNNHSI